MHLGWARFDAESPLHSGSRPWLDIAIQRRRNHELDPVAAFLFLVGGAIAYFVTLYNGLIAVKNNVDKAWANIDVLLKQRHDELPGPHRSLQGLHEI